MRTDAEYGALIIAVLAMACAAFPSALRLEPGQRTTLRVGQVGVERLTGAEAMSGSAGEALVLISESRRRGTHDFVYRAVRAGDQTLIVTPANLHDGDCISCVTVHFFVTVVASVADRPAVP